MVEQMPLMAVVDVNLKGEMAGGLIWRRKFGVEIDGSRKRAERFIVRIPLQMNPDRCYGGCGEEVGSVGRLLTERWHPSALMLTDRWSHQCASPSSASR